MEKIDMEENSNQRNEEIDDRTELRASKKVVSLVLVQYLKCS